VDDPKIFIRGRREILIFAPQNLPVFAFAGDRNSQKAKRLRRAIMDAVAPLPVKLRCQNEE
jgi:hypothetical protein